MVVQFIDTTQQILAQEQFSTFVPTNLLWYSNEDYIQFRADAARDIAAIEKEEALSSSSSSPLPLSSSFLSSSPMMNNHHRKEFVQHVLYQQSEQKLMGISDPKGLQVISRTCSKDAKLRARQKALEIARDVGSLKAGDEKILMSSYRGGGVSSSSSLGTGRTPLWSRRSGGVKQNIVSATMA